MKDTADERRRKADGLNPMGIYDVVGDHWMYGSDDQTSGPAADMEVEGSPIDLLESPLQIDLWAYMTTVSL